MKQRLGCYPTGGVDEHTRPWRKSMVYSVPACVHIIPWSALMWVMFREMKWLQAALLCICCDSELTSTGWEQWLVSHFLCSHWRWESLHNTYPGNNDVWFDSLLGVSLQGLFSTTTANERKKQNREWFSSQKEILGPNSYVLDLCLGISFLYDWSSALLYFWFGLFQHQFRLNWIIAGAERHC